MKKNTLAQMIATLVFRLRSASERPACDTGAHPHDCDHIDEDHEGHEAQRDRDIAALAGLGRRVVLAVRVAHRNSSRGRAPMRCSARRVANSSARYRIEKANRLRA